MGEEFNRYAYEAIYEHRDWKEMAGRYEDGLGGKLMRAPYVQQAARTALTQLSTRLNDYYKNPEEPPGTNDETAAGGEAARRAAAAVAGENAERIEETAPDDAGKTALEHGEERPDETPKEDARKKQNEIEEAGEQILQNQGAEETARRMLEAYKHMETSIPLKDLLYFRLALIAFVLTKKGRFLLETMKGAQAAHVSGGEDLSEPAVMYMTVDPIPVDVLRQEFAEGHQFPHEIVYKIMLNELRDIRSEKAAERRNLALQDDETRKLIREVEGLERRISTLLKEIRCKIQSQTVERNNIRNAFGTSMLLMRLWGEVSAKNYNFLKTMEIISRKLSNIDKVLRKNHTALSENDTALWRMIGEYRKIRSAINRLEKNRIKLGEKAEEIQKTLSEKGCQPEGYQYTLFGRSRGEVMKNIGDDASNADAHDLALNIYTTGAYLSMTKGQKDGEDSAKTVLSDERADDYVNTGFGSYEYSSSAELGDPDLKDSIFKLIRISSRMSQEALEERGQYLEAEQDGERPGKGAYIGTTYRGGRLTEEFDRLQGETITLKALTSSTKDIGKAKEYYRKKRRDVGAGKAVLIRFDLDGKGAVDISGVSKVQKEQEVLIPIGTTFRVEEKKDDADEGYLGDVWGINERESGDNRPFRGAVLHLREISGPGSDKREEAGLVGDMRREIRGFYN